MHSTKQTNLLKLIGKCRANCNCHAPQLIEFSLSHGEGSLTSTGALSVTTGKYTGRSPNDKFFLRESKYSQDINWGDINQAMRKEHFDQLFDDVLNYLDGKELYIFDGYAGADPNYRLNLRVINELAWQNLFAHQLLVRPTDTELSTFSCNYHIICVPEFKAEPQKHGTNSEAVIAVNLDEKIIIVGGTSYAGEIKKAIFTLINFVLPKSNILSMHCSANVGRTNDDVALFFGLSGTGKTTLSADPDRRLIGDDEHGWSQDGIFNIEGGCYAKCIGLDPDDEPQIWNAIRFGSVLENVIVDETTREPDFSANDLTENTRSAYPIEYIPDSVIPGTAGHPGNIFFLTADAFGVLPPLAKLNNEQAMYHFLSGYTSKLAGTERGIKEPEATFSECFGAPFLPLPPLVYANMLGERINKHQSKVYLINTGWTGGPYGVGHRFKLAHTRALIKAALQGQLDDIPCRKDPIFGFDVPLMCPGVPESILTPRQTWQNPDDYDKQARRLALSFKENFKKFHKMSANILTASPAV